MAYLHGRSIASAIIAAAAFSGAAHGGEAPNHAATLLPSRVPEPGSERAARPADHRVTPLALRPHLRPGRRISNVFSISQSISADGYDELVGRNGGSGDYVVSRSSPDDHEFEARFRYDGSPTSEGAVSIRARGATTCWNGQCRPTTDASGPLFNVKMWGLPPRSLSRGATWHVIISEPWELAGQGSETVTVMDSDTRTACATLMRVGESRGAALSDRDTVRLKRGAATTEFRVTVGPSRWRGTARFCNGVVVSDELVVERTDILLAADGSRLPARRRSIMLLNAAPHPTLPES